MTYEEFKSDHDYLVTELIFTESKQSDTLVERLERLSLKKDKHIKPTMGGFIRTNRGRKKKGRG